MISIIKPEIRQNAGEIGFNVFTIKNNSNKNLKIRPFLELPTNWSIFSNIFTDTIIEANGSISLPIRFKSSPESISKTTYSIIVKVFIENPKIIKEDSFNIILDEYHNWDMEIPKKRAFFYPEKDEASFSLKLINNGNTSDTINITIDPDRRIKLFGLGAEGDPFIMVLQAKTDTTLFYAAQYSYSKDRVFDINKVKVLATSKKKKVLRTVILEKYSDTYSPFDIDKTLSHETEIGFRSFSSSKELLPFLRARGASVFKNESKFRYNLTYYDITNDENFISNTYYNLLYTWDDFNFGVGAFSSNLGRNLYSRNCLMVSNGFSINENTIIEGYASYGLTSPKANIAAAYKFDNNKINMQVSASLDIDSYNKRNTISAVYKTGRIKIIKNHDIRLSIYGYQEMFDVKNPYQLSGLAWDFNYFGKFGRNISVQFTNNYGSPNIPGPQMGLKNFYTKIKYKPGESEQYITITYINSARNYFFYDHEGTKMPNIKLADQYVNLLYHFDYNKKARFYIGPSMEHYNSSHPVPDVTERIKYDVNKYRIEFKLYFGSHIMTNVKYGLGVMNQQNMNEIGRNVHDFHILSEYNNNGYGIRAAYDNGPMVNMGLYQYALDAGNHSISISPYILKSYLKDRIGVSLFTNYTHRFDLNYGSLNINPKIEAFIYRNWYAVVGGTYTYTQQKYGELNVQNSFQYIEFSVKKKWGNSDYYRWRKDLRRLKIQLFKDENGNGKMDRGEKGIAEVKVRILLKNTADQKARENFPVDITLMSNEKGIVTFNKIPRGFYQLTIVPLSDLNEYFYIDNTSNNIEMLKNITKSIPFQKSDKIVGKIEIIRRKFVAEKDEQKNMANIKVTAFNEKGDSYSSFTRSDGSFTIYAPGNNVYYVRIKNVFGNDFMIMNNDSRRRLVDSTSMPVEIRVVEKSRKINFKKAKATSHSPNIQKVKVLPGKIYHNENNKPVDINSIPNFNIPDKQVKVEEIIAGKFYLIAGEFKDIRDATKALKIIEEQGIGAKIGISGDPPIYYISIDNSESKEEANTKLRNYRRVGLKPIIIKKIKE